MTQVRLLDSVLLVTTLLALAAFPAHAAAGDRLFVLGDRLDTVPDRAKSGYRADVDVWKLNLAERLDLELPGDRWAEIERVRLDRRSGGDVLWTGRTRLGEEAVLTVVGGRLAGTFFGRERGYQIQPHEDGGHVLLEMDPDTAPGCGGVPLLEASDEGSELEARSAVGGASRASHRTPRVDILVVYATNSTATVGSKRNMLTVIQHFVDVTNVAFHNSGIEARLRLVHAAEVEVEPSITAGSSAALQWLVGSESIADLRDAHGADMVGLVYESTARCGSAAMIYRPGGPTLSRAYFVSRRDCGADTFAHEVGHVLGADHDPENSIFAQGRYIYGRGHLHDGIYRTVMSYTTGCSLGCAVQPFFSNPHVRYEKRATGISEERDNARIINEFAADIERFSPAIDSAGCSLEPGDRDYCLECGPCLAGEGSCESDSECDTGLACDPDGGPDFGFPARVGVCRASGGCELAPGDPDYCRLCGPCGFGDGDCDGDRECQAGLVCLDDVGSKFGLAASTDVCGFPDRGFCGANYPFLPSLGDPDYCQVCGPCRRGEGSCTSTSQCGAFLTCFPDVGAELGFPSATAVCLQALPSACGRDPGHPDYCKLCGVCDVGEGDCDGDRECRDGLTCVDGGGGAFGFDEAIDVCLEALRPPKRLKAKAVSSSRVRLKWKDKSRNENGFHVEMSTEGGRFERIASTGANAKKLVVGDLESGATYTFRVQAFNVDGASPYSNQRSVTLP